jgi:hypothetical protein
MPKKLLKKRKVAPRHNPFSLSEQLPADQSDAPPGQISGEDDYAPDPRDEALPDQEVSGKNAREEVLDGETRPSLEEQGIGPAKNKGGRPRNPPRPVERFSFLPKPPRFKFLPSGDTRPFFRYWAEIYKGFPDRVQCYVYRRWPIINRAVLNKTKNIDKPLSPIRPDGWKEELLHRYGAGDYRLILSDMPTNRMLCQAIVELPHDLAEHPPLLEKEDLVLTDPQNRSYIEFLRQRGEQFPGDTGYMSRVEGETVAETKAVVQVLAESLDKNQDRMFNMMREERDAKTEKTEGEEKGEGGEGEERSTKKTVSDMSAGVQVVADAAAIGNKILQRAIEDSSKVTHADPMALVGKIMEFSKTMVPSSAGNDKMLEAMEKLYAGVSESAARRADLMEQVLWANMGFSISKDDKGNNLVTRQQYNPIAGAAGVGAAPGTPGGFMGAAPAEAPRAPTILGELENMAKIKHALEDAGILPAAELAERKGWLEYMPLIMTGIQFITGSIASIMYNRAVASGQGQPIPPPMPERAQVPGMEMQPSVPATGSYPQPMPTSAPGPMPGSSPQGADVNLGGMITFLRKIEQPLLNHLKQGASGADFADWLIMSEEQGQLIYDSIVEAGKASLIQLLQLHPPVWHVATSIPQRFDAFLDEFLSPPPAEEELPDEPAPAPRVMARHRAPQTPRNESVKTPDAAAPAPAPGPVIDIRAERIPSSPRAARVKSPAASPAGDAI